MNWIRKHRPSPAMAVALAALALALGGVAFAAIPDSTGTIHACYQKRNGNLRVVESDECRAGEWSLSWSQSGPGGGTGARAYAHVLEDGTLDASKSQNVQGVVFSTVNDEAYCFALGFAPVSISVTPQGGSAYQTGASIEAAEVEAWCPPGFRDAVALTQGRNSAYALFF
jgi:hypothetical protein